MEVRYVKATWREFWRDRCKGFGSVLCVLDEIQHRHLTMRRPNLVCDLHDGWIQGDLLAAVRERRGRR